MRPELDRIEALERHLADTGSLAGSVVQALDLRGRASLLHQVPVTGAVFIGCRMDDALAADLVRRHAAIQPIIEGVPFQSHRNQLYTAHELFDEYRSGDAASLASTLDMRIYRWTRQTPSLVDAIAKRLHDASIDDALSEFIAEHRGNGGRGVVAITGGHSLARDDVGYASVVRLARLLTRAGFLVACGGGPGAMEATNLGGWLATHPDDHLDRALQLLAVAPRYDSVSTWLDGARSVLEELGGEVDGVSLGIPTWHFGHEPPNVFASHIAKYFDNSIREDGLLAIATSGVVFTPGSAGTIQEIFQDAAQNHYETFDGPSPMVFLGVDYWTVTKPVFPLLQRLAADRPYGSMLAIHDDIEAVARHLGA